MGIPHLFEVGALKNDWLAASQTAVASNVANVNTPNYKAQATTSFQAELETARLRMTVTDAGHFTGVRNGVPVREAEANARWEIIQTQSPVKLEGELMKAAKISSEHSLNTGIMTSFHRMILTSARG